MTDIIHEKIANSNWTLIDFALVGVSKRTTEILLTPVIGNGTIKSGLIKVAAAVALDQFAPKAGLVGKVGNFVEGGLVIDGVEDVTLALLGSNPLGFLFGQSNEAAQAESGMIII